MRGLSERRLSARALACVLAAAALFVAPSVASAAEGWEFGGHAKAQLLYGTYPGESLLADALGRDTFDQYVDLRLNTAVRRQRWELRADYQIDGGHGDTQAGITRASRGAGLGDPAAALLVGSPIVDDDRRLVDLTWTIHRGGDDFALHRLDRLYVSYTGERLVARVGRQVLSWGNGLVYTPMDFFNPFDPAAVDREYKAGDDMLYAQYLFADGHDLQAVVVGRRDPNDGDVEADRFSFAAKYHGFAGDGEYDLLLAHHFGDTIVALGGNRPLGGAVWRGDLVLTDTGHSLVASLVTSIGYSWVWWGKNVNGLVEYFYNGFGTDDGHYTVADLERERELVRRIERGELFTAGRNYLAGSATVELTPLWTLAPNLFLNASDGSVFAQLVSRHDLAENWQLLLAAGIPLGPSGTEFGGIDVGFDDRTLGAGYSLFGQLAFYF